VYSFLWLDTVLDLPVNPTAVLPLNDEFVKMSNLHVGEMSLPPPLSSASAVNNNKFSPLFAMSKSLNVLRILQGFPLKSIDTGCCSIRLIFVKSSKGYLAYLPNGTIAINSFKQTRPHFTFPTRRRPRLRW
jgi:hypothetical protein